MDIGGLVNGREQPVLPLGTSPFGLPPTGTPLNGGPTSAASLPSYPFPQTSPTLPPELPGFSDSLSSRKRSSHDSLDLPGPLGPLGSSARSRKKSQTDSDDRRMPSAKDYPRRRALQACQICRARKTKCDNERPTCGSCEALGVECSYNEAPASKYLPPTNYR